MAREIRKKDKICLVCGVTFKGIASAQTCTPACRTALVRIKAEGKRPDFILMAKSKGQKIPDLNAPKRLKFKKGEKKAKSEMFDMGVLESKIEYAAVTPESYDAPPLSSLIMDEAGLTAPPMTKEQIFQKIAELEKKKKEISERKSLSGSPKANALQKSMEIDKVDEKIDWYKKLL